MFDFLFCESLIVVFLYQTFVLLFLLHFIWHHHEILPELSLCLFYRTFYGFNHIFPTPFPILKLFFHFAFAYYFKPNSCFDDDSLCLNNAVAILVQIEVGEIFSFDDSFALFLYTHLDLFSIDVLSQLFFHRRVKIQVHEVEGV